MRMILAMLLLAVGGLNMIGCECTPRAKARQIVATLDPALAADPRMGTVEVDFVFVKEGDMDDWDKKRSSLDKYFGGLDNDRDRANKLTAIFRPGDEPTWERTKTEVEKTEFIPEKSLMYLYILAKLPDGEDMARVNLDHCYWRERKARGGVDVTVKHDELKVLPFDN